MYVFHMEHKYEEQHICCKIFQKVKEKESNATLDAFMFATNVIDGIFTGKKKGLHPTNLIQLYYGILYIFPFTMSVNIRKISDMFETK